MIGDLQRLVAAQPFVSFTIFTGDGESVRVETVDHIAVSPAGGRIVVFADDDSVNHISPLLVARIVVDAVPQSAGAV